MKYGYAHKARKMKKTMLINKERQRLLQITIQHALIKLGICNKENFNEFLRDDRLYTYVKQ